MLYLEVFIINLKCLLNDIGNLLIDVLPQLFRLDDQLSYSFGRLSQPPMALALYEVANAMHCCANLVEFLAKIPSSRLVTRDILRKGIVMFQE